VLHTVVFYKLTELLPCFLLRWRVQPPPPERTARMCRRRLGENGTRRKNAFCAVGPCSGPFPWRFGAVKAACLPIQAVCICCTIRDLVHTGFGVQKDLNLAKC